MLHMFTKLLIEWKAERPDIDALPLAVCGAIWQTGDTLKKEVSKKLKAFNLAKINKFIIVLKINISRFKHLQSRLLNINTEATIWYYSKYPQRYNTIEIIRYVIL